MLGKNSSGKRGNDPVQNMPAALTDIGCEREINEDRYAVVDSHLGRVWVVCDGMGGCLGGELAAQLAIDAIRRKLESTDAQIPETGLVSAVEEANRIILLRRQNPAFSSMGTTVVTALLYNNEEVLLSHAGDSRAYLIREGNIQQLTTDHTYVQDLVERGVIKPHEALSHPQAHVLTRCLGAEANLNLDLQKYWVWPVEEGKEDKLLLCSDGLYSLVDDDEIAEICTTYQSQESCIRLTELAKSHGGYDNITVAIIPIPGELREEKPTQKVAKAKTVRKPTYSVARRRLSPEKRIGLIIFMIALGILIGLPLALLKIMSV
ncbi:MAG: serine/threonine-protein phosphatase [Deltaproteobacteria bacterium]|nr:serine/threonine-protein phosphatase [Deltaproteobacteria bacterium]